MSDFERMGFAVGIDAELERFEASMQQAGRVVETTAAGMDKATRRAAQQFNRLEAALDPSARAAQRLERDTAKVTNALDRGVISSQRAAETQRRLNDQYEQTIARLNGVTGASARSSAVVAQGSRRLSAATSAHRRMGLAAQNAAFQVGDFAVQVAGGTAASRAFAQQAPQLLGAFGLFGAVAGAAVAVGAALAPVLLRVEEATGEAADAQKRYRDSLAETNNLMDSSEELSRALAAARSNEAIATMEAGLAVESELRSRLIAQRRELAEFAPMVGENAPLGESATASQIRQRLAEIDDSFDESAARTDNLLARLALLRDSLGQTSADTRDFNEAQREAARSANEAERAYAAITERTRDIGLETQVATKAVSEIDAEVIKAEASLREAGVTGARLEMALTSLRTALEEQEAATGSAAQALQDYDEKMAALAQQTAVLRGAMTESEAAAADVRRTLEEAGVGIEEAAERAEAFRQALDLKEAAETAKRQLEEYEKDVVRVGREVGEAFTDNLLTSMESGFDGIDDLFQRWLRSLAVTAINNAIVVPISTEIVGAVPSVFGLGQRPAGTAGVAPGADDVLGQAGDLLGMTRSLFGSGGLGGIGNTPLFSTLPADFVGPPMAGQVFTLGEAFGGLGIGAGIGGLLSGLTGGNSLIGSGAGAALGVAGTAIGGPIGGAIGGVLGGLFGGLFGGKPSVGPNAVARIVGRDGTFFGLGGRADNGGDQAAAARAAGELADMLNALVGVTGAEMVSYGGRTIEVGNFPSRGGQHLTVADRDVVARLERIYGPSRGDPHSSPNRAFFLGDQTMAAAVQAGLFQAEFEDLNDTFETIIDTVTRTRMSLEEIEAAFGFGGLYDAVVAAERPLSDVQQSLADLVRQLEEGSARAGALDLSVRNFRAGMRTSFDRDVADRILAIEDPQAAALAQFDRDAEAWVETARALGADLVQVERMIALEREEVIRRTAGDSFGDLEEEIRQALSGDLTGGLSPLSPNERLQEAQREFDRLIATEDAGAAIRQRDVLLEAADAVFGATTRFASIFGASGAALESLIPGRAMGGPVFGPGGPTDDLIPAMLSNGEFVVRAAAAERIGMDNLAMMNATGAMSMRGGDGATANEVRGLREDLRAVAGALVSAAEEGVRQGGEQARTGQRMLRQLQGINRNLIERG